MEKVGIIQGSLSPYAYQIVIIPEKCPLGSLVQEAKRLCVDYRKLKAQVPTVHWRKATDAVTFIDIPKIDEMIVRLQLTKFFTSLDLRSGYHYIKISPETRYKIAFTTIFGKCKFLIIPFELEQCPAYFAAMMKQVLGAFSDFCFFHMDDVLVYMIWMQKPSHTFENDFWKDKRSRMKAEVIEVCFL